MSGKPEGLPEMEYRFLGRSGLKVSAISLGGWLTYGGHVDRGEPNDTLHYESGSRANTGVPFIEGTYACMKAAYDSGVNFFDCAEEYAKGESEKVMGEAIKKYDWNRNDLVVSTKVTTSPLLGLKWGVLTSR